MTNIKLSLLCVLCIALGFFAGTSIILTRLFNNSQFMTINPITMEKVK